MNWRRRELWLLAMLWIAAMSQLRAQDLQTKTLSIPRLAQKPTLADFEGMEPSSELARAMKKIDHFVQRNPTNGAPASQRTEGYIGYTDQNLYVVFLCFDNKIGQARAHVNRREDIQQDDQIGFFLDSFNDRKHAYTFYVNPVGVQQDGTWV